MGFIGKLFILGVIGSGVFLGIKINKALQPTPAPVMDEPYWGPGKPVKDDTAIKPFKINIDNKVLEDLKSRLTKHRALTPSLETTAQDYGINSKLLKDIVTYWIEKYDWRKREAFLNKFPQFTTKVQGLNIHYLHVKPQKTDGVEVVPLLLLHGWPGSIREFYDIIPILTKKQPNRNFVFEVIAPSLPGYGFSEAASKPGLGAAEMAVVFKNFMKKLGFDKYYLQGGDWGAIIVTHIATLYKEHVLGVHSNMCFANSPMANLKLILGSFAPSLVIPDEFSKYRESVYPLSNFMYTMLLEMGYMHLQATKPDTIGVALNDSPVGLAAYIIEKFTTWTNNEWKALPDGGLTKKFKYDDLLDNVMIYWVTNSITTSMRLYSETFNIKQESLGINTAIVEVPAGCAAFPNEVAYSSEWIVKDKYVNLMHFTHQKDGGHFAAFEVPQLLAEDIFVAVDKFRQSKQTKKP